MRLDRSICFLYRRHGRKLEPTMYIGQTPIHLSEFQIKTLNSYSQKLYKLIIPLKTALNINTKKIFKKKLKSL